MIGLLLIVFSGIGYKVIFRTKLREEEIFALDAYYAKTRLQRFYSFVRLW
jgi:amino acid transporter